MQEFLYEKLVDNDFEPSYAKEGDVGIDLPILFKGAKFIDENSCGLFEDKRHEGNKCELFDEEAEWQEIKKDIVYSKNKKILYLNPGFWYSFPTGIAFKAPDHHWFEVKPRSSTGWKKRLWVFPGSIDSGYNGQIFTLLFNSNKHRVKVQEGDKLIQIILHKSCSEIPLKKIKKLPITKRGNSGFGSSGR